MQSTTLKAGQQETVTAFPDDGLGNAGLLKPGSVPVWASSDPTIATVAAAADGLSAVLAGIAPGSATITVDGVSSFADSDGPQVVCFAGRAPSLEGRGGVSVMLTTCENLLPVSSCFSPRCLPRSRRRARSRSTGRPALHRASRGTTSTRESARPHLHPLDA